MDLRGPLQSGAKAMMAAPNSIDVAQFSDAFQKAAAATTVWTQVQPIFPFGRKRELKIYLQNVIGGAGLDILASTPTGVSGPLARDIGNVFETAFIYRKDVGAEVSSFIRTFEKRESKYQSQIASSSENLKKTSAVIEVCMARSQNVEKVTSTEIVTKARFRNIRAFRCMKVSKRPARVSRLFWNASCAARQQERRRGRSESKPMPLLDRPSWIK
jgi:hypothetical protein